MSEELSIFQKYPDYEAVIGMEVHVQLNTETKIFCPCKNSISNLPNQNICEVCCAYPGTLPVLNEKVVDYAIMAALGINAEINENNCFDRKHYFYADLPKGYQITQNFFPYCKEGFVEIKDENGNLKKIRIHHIHMEEDAGKNTHTDEYGSLVDYNRAGTPLLEIVSYPDMKSAFEVRAYLKELYSIMTSLNITTGNMEEGAFRADANVSVRKKGAEKLGTKCELKNINSFKFIYDAVQYEIERQIEEIENGGIIKQQTRLWDTKLKKTYVMREKEGAEDYRYFPDPDLMPLKIDKNWIEKIKNLMPELPIEKKKRFVKDFGLSEYEAEVLVEDVFAAKYFEKAYVLYNSKNLVNWILREIMGIAKEKRKNLDEILFREESLVDLVKLLDEQKITQKIAKDVFEKCFESGIKPSDYVKENNLIVEFLSEDKIREIISNLINQNKSQFLEYKSGKDRLKGFFIGKVMAETKGCANPEIINKIFNEF